jgi:hypothetical protein
LAKEQGLSLTGPDGLLKQLTKMVLETAQRVELLRPGLPTLAWRLAIEEYQLGDQPVAFLNRALDTRSPSRTTL